MFVDILLKFVLHSFLQLWASSIIFLSFYVVSHLQKNFLKVSNVVLSSGGVSQGTLKPFEKSCKVREYIPHP